MFVHTDGQLRAAHLILDYTPLSFNCQALKNVVKAKDPRLPLINIAMPDFLILGPGPQGVLKVELLLQYKAED